MVAAISFVEDAHFEHGPRQFLDEQWNSVGLGRDLSDKFGGNRAASDHPLNHPFDIGLLEAAERQRRYVRQVGPWRGEFTSEGNDPKKAEPPGLFFFAIQLVERNRDRPMC